MIRRSHTDFPAGSALLAPIAGNKGIDMFECTVNDEFDFEFAGGSFDDIREARALFDIALGELWPIVRNAEMTGRAVPETELDKIASAGRQLALAVMAGFDDFVTELQEHGVGSVIMPSSMSDLRFPWALLRTADGRWLGELVMIAGTRKGIKLLRLPKKEQEAPRGRATGDILAGYAEDDMLDCAVGRCDKGSRQALSALEQLVSRSDIDILDPLGAGPLSPSDRDLMQEWLAESRSLFHFNAHNEGEDGAGSPRMRLSAGASASAQDLKNDIPVRAPVVLNICSSSKGRHADDNSFAGVLRHRRAPAVCSTNGVITEEFGTAFAHALYDEAAKADHNLFEAVRKAQHRLYRETRHPMGYLYVFEGCTHQSLRR